MIPPLLRAVRLHQWSKNAVVFAAPVFALGDKNQHVSPWVLAQAFGVFVLFGFAASAVYLVNDILDRERDQKHNVKRKRPIASGDLSVRHALQAAGILSALSLVLGVLLSPPFAWIIASYFVLQALYTGGLKHVVYVDVLCIALGFVLRTLAGAYGCSVEPSSWLAGCAFLLALFIGLCKRYGELAEYESSVEGDTARPSLQDYHLKSLRRVVSGVAAATLCAYVIYTLSPDSVSKFGNTRLIFTAPFVAMGLWRYLHLVLSAGKGERPEHILFSDKWILCSVGGFALCVFFLLFHVGP